MTIKDVRRKNTQEIGDGGFFKLFTVFTSIFQLFNHFL